MPNNKIEPIKSKLYKEWVKVKLCCHCQAPADDPHHLIGFDGIMGGTADDNFAVPLCRGCHTEIHNDFGWAL